eukprot:gene8887-biopygen4401
MAGRENSSCPSSNTTTWWRTSLCPTKDIANRRVSASFAAIPLQKDTLGNVLPTTPESVWPQLPSIVALGKPDFSARRKFRAFQHGVWKAALAAKQIRGARTSDPRNVVVALDGHNAYNSASRRAIPEATFGDAALRHTWGIACLCLTQLLGLYLQPG